MSTFKQLLLGKGGLDKKERKSREIVQPRGKVLVPRQYTQHYF